MNFDEIAKLVVDNSGEKLNINDFQLDGLDWGSSTLWGILDWLQSLIVTAVMSVFKLCFTGVEKLSNVNQYFPDNSQVIINGIADIATMILIIIFLKQIFTNYILDLDGEADADAIQALVNISVALAVINCGSEIHKYSMKICDMSVAYIGELLTAATIQTHFTTTDIISNFLKQVIGSLALTFVPGGAWVLAFGVIWLIVVGVLMVVLSFKILFRGVELFIFQCLMPIFACDLVTPNKELWRPFFKAYLITIFGWLIQYTCLMLSVVILLEAGTMSAGIEGLMSPLISTVMLYFACKAPKWLQSLTYQTGAGQAASSGARGLVGGASQVISAARAIK